MLHTSYIEISESAFRKNVRYLQKRFDKARQFSSVVKGNAYGHGIEYFIPMAERAGLRHFAVFNADEAVRVLKVKQQVCDIMVMGMLENEEMEWALNQDVEFFVFELDRLQYAIATAKKLNKPARIHLEVETGMNRTGLNVDELKEAVKMIKAAPEAVKVEGFCTHYAGAESVSNYLRIQKQIERYEALYQLIRDKGLEPRLRHTACSAAALNYPETVMDMVRIGIAQYGFWPSQETYINQLSGIDKKGKNPLKRILSWKSKVMSTKWVKAGEFIGYGTSYMAPKDIKIATVPVGYAHGFSRSLSNQGRVLIHNRRVPVVGMVNMNMMTIDVTNVPDVKKGDEVVLIGRQKNLSISVSAFGELSSQLNYELLTRLPGGTPREVVK